MFLVIWWINIENRDVAVHTLPVSDRGGVSKTEKVVLKMEHTIFEYRRERDISIYMWPTFSHVAVVYESNRAIWENVAMRTCVLHLWLMTAP